VQFFPHKAHYPKKSENQANGSISLGERKKRQQESQPLDTHNHQHNAEHERRKKKKKKGRCGGKLQNFGFHSVALFSLLLLLRLLLVLSLLFFV
jgi:hypothetical protein